MNEAVLDSTVLIFLAKLRRLDLLENAYQKIYTPEKVRKEVVEEGKKRGERDANLVDRKIKDGAIKVRKTKIDEEIEGFDLGPGESQTLSLAKEVGGDLLVDDESAREAARILKIKPKGTLYFLAKGLRKCDLNFDEYLEYLETLTEEGFYMDETVYIEAVRKGRKNAEKKEKEDK